VTAPLRPCPFCGGEALRLTLTEEDGPGNVGGDAITCLGCGASSHVEFGYKENLVSIWNSRTADRAFRRIQDEANTVGDWRENASMIDSICIAELAQSEASS
jgi:Lar family restriction alleviation protein